MDFNDAKVGQFSEMYFSFFITTPYIFMQTFPLLGGSALFKEVLLFQFLLYHLK